MDASFSKAQRSCVEAILMFGAGSVQIELHCDPRQGRVRAAHVMLERMPVASLLLQRSPDEAIEMAATLHALFGQAHRLAALRAVQAARNRADRSKPHPPRSGGSARETAAERAALIEATLDHLCRLYLDWPQALNMPRQPHRVLEWKRRLRKVDITVADSDIAALRDHADRLLSAVPQVAGIAERLRQRIHAAAACLTALKLEPTNPGHIRRLVSVEDWLQWKEDGPPSDEAAADGIRRGEGRTFTARGELIHRVGLSGPRNGESVVEWSIDTPTDRLFMSGGPVADALRQLQGTHEQIEALARLVVLSFAPCVETQIQVFDSC